MCRRRNSAFTIVELLVVSGVIAILIALLLPALRVAQRAAMAAECLSNLRQMGIATQNYLVEQHNVYPQPFQDGDLSTQLAAASCWFNALDRFVGAKVRNYSATTDRNYNPFKQDPIYRTLGEDTAATGGSGSRTFKMNANFGDLAGGSVKWTRTSWIRKGSDTVLLFDGIAQDLGFTIGAGSGFHGTETDVGLRHGRGRTANVLFVDGHAAEVSQLYQQRTFSGTKYFTWYPEPDVRQTLIWKFR